MRPATDTCFQVLIAVSYLPAVVRPVIFRDDKRVFSALLKIRQLLAAHLSQLVKIWFLYIFLLLSHFIFSFL